MDTYHLLKGSIVFLLIRSRIKYKCGSFEKSVFSSRMLAFRQEQSRTRRRKFRSSFGMRWQGPLSFLPSWLLVWGIIISSSTDRNHIIGRVLPCIVTAADISDCLRISELFSGQVNVPCFLRVRCLVISLECLSSRRVYSLLWPRWAGQVASGQTRSNHVLLAAVDFLLPLGRYGNQ